MATTNLRTATSESTHRGLGGQGTDKPTRHGYGGRPPAIAGIDRRRSVGLNTAAAPLEYLNYHRALATSADTAIAAGADQWRWASAMTLRSALEGGEYSGVKSPDLGRIGGGKRPGFVGDHRLDCMKKIARWRAIVPVRLFKLAVAVVGDDVWAWEGLKPGEGEKVLERIRLALDYIAHDAGVTPQGWFKARWARAPARRRATDSTIRSRT